MTSITNRRNHSVIKYHDFNLTWPRGVNPFKPGLTTVICRWEYRPDNGRVKACEFSCTYTDGPEPIRLTNDQLDFLQKMIAQGRRAYLECLVAADQDPGAQENLDDAIQCFQGILDQHTAALAADKGDKDVELTDLFEVLKIEDQGEHERALENMMEGLKL